jgi:hypothetical protein
MGQFWYLNLVMIQMVWPSACTRVDHVRLLLATILINMSLRRRPSQLSPLAARPDYIHPLPQFRHRIHSLSPLSSEYARTRPLLQYA